MVAQLRRPHPAALIQILAIVPALAIVQLVHNSSELQWFDYWHTLRIYTNGNGSLRPLDLLYYTQGQVPAVPSFLYWLNVHLTGGLNRPLGYYDIAVVVAEILLLRFLLPRPEWLGRWWHSWLVVGFAVLLFAPQGAWGFSRAGSGTAWLTANLLTLTAIAFAARGRYVWAIPFAGLASLSYATGLMAWPAVIVIALLRTPWRSWSWRRWALIGAGAVTIGTYLAFYKSSPNNSTAGLTFNDIARRTLQVIGSVLSPDPNLALLAGAIGVGLAGFAAVTSLRRTDLREPSLPWIGIALYAFLSSLLIGLVRGGIHEENLGVTSRYAPLSVLLWAAVLALCVIRFRPDPRVWVLGFAVAALAFASGQPTLASMQDSNHSQDELAIAMRLGLATGYTYAPSPADIPFFRALHHYPYSSSFHAGCGLLGKRIDASSVVPANPRSKGHLDRFEPPVNTASVRVSGWFASADGDVRCILITNRSLRVIGAAATGYERPDIAAIGSPSGSYDVGFVGVAPSGEHEYRAFAVVSGRKGFYEVPGTLSAPAQASAAADSSSSP